jgi:NTE family protein
LEAAVTRLWATDSWLNPRTGQYELNADLVLEGGGVKGIGLAGEICVLAEAGYHFPCATGSSAGAIAAVLAAAVEKSGQHMTVLRDYLSGIGLRPVQHTGPVRHAFEHLGRRFADVYELMFHSGHYSGGYLNAWLNTGLGECGVTKWADLAISAADDPERSLPAGQQYRPVGDVSDISHGMLALLPWDYEDYYGLRVGKQRVISAVRASRSIPFFVVPVHSVTLPPPPHCPMTGCSLALPGR